MKTTLELPAVSPSKLTDDLLKKVSALVELIGTDKVVEKEKEISAQLNIHPRTLGRYKLELRKMFGMASRSPLTGLSSHPQLRQALTFILLREGRDDKGTLRSVKDMVVIEGNDFRKTSVEQFLIAQYSFPNMTAQNCFDALRNMVVYGRVYKESEGESIKCTLKELPSVQSVTRFLRLRRESNLNPNTDESMALKKARSTKKQFDALNFFIRQNPEEFRVRGYVEIDHTETDVEIVRTETGQIDRFWHTSVIDYHSSLACGYNLTFQPNSSSIALAVRNAMLGTQLKIATPGVDDKGNPIVEYVPIPEPVDFCDFVKLDNGKDFRSRYTQQVFGKIDISEDVRRSLNAFCEIGYAQPYHPQSKPHVERSFGVMNMFYKLFPGYTGSNYSKKPESLKKEKEEGLLLTDAQFIQLFELSWNVYNNRPNRRLGGMSKIQYYLAKRKLTKGLSERVLDFLLMKSDKTPTIRQGWIVIDSVDYGSPQLAPFDGQRCNVFYDPQNIGLVHCYINGEYKATAINKEMFGRSQKENLELVKLRGKKDADLNKLVKEIRAGKTHLEAKASAFMGMLHNVRLTPLEELQASTPIVTTLTKLEEEANTVAEATKQATQLVEIEKEAKNKSKQRLLTLSMVEKLK